MGAQLSIRMKLAIASGGGSRHAEKFPSPTELAICHRSHFFMVRAILTASLRLFTCDVTRNLSSKPRFRAVRFMATNTNGGSSAATDVETFVRDGQKFTQVQEGLARILVPFSENESREKTSKSIEEQQQVFYNPIQQFNRDLTVLAIKAYGESALSKSRAANAKHVAKRKREKLDNDGRDPKKHEISSETADNTSSEILTSQEPTTATVTEGEDVTMANDQNGQEQEEEKASESLKAEEDKASLGEEKPANLPQGPKFTILDALSATGLRALRYAQELPFVTSVTANDLTPSAVEAIRRNAVHNGVDSKVNATQGDARAHMYSLIVEEANRDHSREKHNKKGRGGRRYDVIDLDPYGTAATFFDAAVQSVRDDGGLLCVTCTDSGVWASNGYPEKAFALYGGVPLKGFHSHEVGLRLILNGIATAAARYGLAIEPQLSLSIDYYVRIFVKIRRSPAQVKFLAGKTMITYSCDNGCGAWETQLLARHRKATNKSGKSAFYKHSAALGPTADQLCKHCNSKMHLTGPMYAGPLHNAEFIKKILDDLPNASDNVYGTKPRIEGMLTTALEEIIPAAEDDLPSLKEDEFAVVEPYPFYLHPSALAGSIHCQCPDEDSLRGALRHLGYQVTRSHCKPGSMKTNASWSVIWHIMREWVRQKQPVKVEKIKQNSAAWNLLRLGKKDDEPVEEVDKLEVVFDQKLGKDNTKRGLTRYQTNPKENWGPQSRAKGH
ncbi:S-adenosyl-L-methionine-dependent methyltransferase [Xylariaceae sp. FL0016]|nr:S-adenosyl-L-methionine-dependent methyltransferase [Xylariaceae sp. FL0016]